MPASARSLQVTAAYRTRLQRTQATLDRDLRALWARIDVNDFDGTWAVARAADRIGVAQRQSQQISTAYLAAYLSSELGRRVDGPVPASDLGTTRAGRPLSDAALGVILGVKAAVGDGRDPHEALAAGLVDLLRTASTATDHVARETLREGMVEDERITGWRRAVKGTCGACLGAATGEVASPGESISVHPNCACVSEPIIAGVPEKITRPAGSALFAAMSTAEQDDLLGPDKAELIRSGDAALADLVDHSPMRHEDDLLTEAPLKAI